MPQEFREQVQVGLEQEYPEREGVDRSQRVEVGAEAVEGVLQEFREQVQLMGWNGEEYPERVGLGHSYKGIRRWGAGGGGVPQEFKEKTAGISGILP